MTNCISTRINSKSAKDVDPTDRREIKRGFLSVFIHIHKNEFRSIINSNSILRNAAKLNLWK